MLHHYVWFLRILKMPSITHQFLSITVHGGISLIFLSIVACFNSTMVSITFVTRSNTCQCFFKFYHLGIQWFATFFLGCFLVCNIHVFVFVALLWFQTRIWMIPIVSRFRKSLPRILLGICLFWQPLLASLCSSEVIRCSSIWIQFQFSTCLLCYCCLCFGNNIGCFRHTVRNLTSTLFLHAYHLITFPARIVLFSRFPDILFFCHYFFAFLFNSSIAVLFSFIQRWSSVSWTAFC